jgi:hypothetical protein
LESPSEDMGLSHPHFQLKGPYVLNAERIQHIRIIGQRISRNHELGVEKCKDIQSLLQP